MVINCIDKIFRHFDLLTIFENQFGIKALGKPGISEVIECYPVNTIITVPANSLLLGPDNLKDNYSSLGLNICKSPYYELMQILQKREDPTYTEYMMRLSRGNLDNRKSIKISEHQISKIQRRFNAGKKEFENGKLLPIKTLTINESIYIFDGKHRAALCSLYKSNIKIIDISPYFYDSYIKKVYDKMSSKKNVYTKHLAFYAKFFKIE